MTDVTLLQIERSLMEIDTALTALSTQSGDFTAFNSLREGLERARDSILEAKTSLEENITPRLRSSEQNFRLLADNIPQLAWMADENGEIFWYNQRWFDYTGVSMPEAQGWGWQQVLHLEHIQRVSKKLRRCLETGKVWEDTFPLRRADGEYHWFLSRAVPIRDESGRITCWFGTNTNVSEQRKTEQALRVSEEKYRKFFENLHEMVAIWQVKCDEQDNIVDWVVADANQALLRAFNRQREEMVGRRLSDLYGGEVLDLATARFMQVLETDRPVYTEFDTQNRHLAVALFRMDTDVLATSAVDVTERFQAQAAQRESEERFRHLANSMPQLVWTALADGTVDYYNERCHEYEGISQRVDGEWTWAPVLHPDDMQPTIEAWEHAVETGQIYQIEHRVRMATGDFRWHLSRGVPAKDDQGNILRWYGTATDIHDYKLAEEAVRVYSQQLERSNRDLEEFAFIASHDLQEPLRKIQMFSELLQSEFGVSLGERGTDYLSRMQDAATRMQQMMNSLLNYSRIANKTNMITPVNLNGILENVLIDLEGQIQQKAGKVEAGDLPVIEGDALQMHQLMQNLIGNAVKYCKPDQPPQIRIWSQGIESRDDGPQVQICVQDNGIGFDEKFIERIFQPFQRLHGRSEYEGYGIGLALCRKIAERHRGSVSAHSVPGEGSTFVVTLPYRQTSI
jgi:PAS domain S-box-containing protein